mgnify:CR=1 FL=1
MNKLRLPDRAQDYLATAEDVAMYALVMTISGLVAPTVRVLRGVEVLRRAKALSAADQSCSEGGTTEAGVSPEYPLTTANILAQTRNSAEQSN